MTATALPYKAMILAAGRGQRMAPLTDHCPKPLLPLAGKPLIQHHIEKLVAAGFENLVINHAWLGQMIEEALGDGESLGCRIQYSAETEALETAGGILNALPLLCRSQQSRSQPFGRTEPEPFLLINGDVWTNWNYQQAADLLQANVLGSDCDALLWLVDNPDHNPNGDFLLKGTQVIDPGSPAQSFDLASQSEELEERLTFAGVSLIHPRLLAGYEPGKRALAPVLREAMAKGRLAGRKLDGQWVDVGTPQRLQQLEQQLMENA
ncbi:N-acetylmuramate alpha-1-phosphate uridylyltransferase MurU [Oceanobacter kriegii]|uniref:N-acetylmuramate alpha-1-phosphate uridylyltransferase MurU n=1 Tax=Oceanobacter kriegii TaxID=64972 RepID=UPI000415497B|nr:nucleotidyltransferase family protein [Oceanobacter kriegii]